MTDETTPKPKKPSKIDLMNLDELYDRPSMTAKVVARIAELEDFSRVQPRWCAQVCKAPAEIKCPEKVRLEYDYAQVTDVVILQNIRAKGDKWKTPEQVERVNLSLLNHLASRYVPLAKNHKILNIAKCHLNDGPKKPTSSHMAACSAYTLYEVKHLKPRVIIATSSEAVKMFGIKDFNANKDRGRIFWVDLGYGLIPIILTLHPRICLMLRQNASGKSWGPDFFGLIARDFAKANDILAGVIRYKDMNEAIEELKAQGRLITCRSIDEVRHYCDFLANLPETKIISWDTETTGLDPWAEDAKFLTHQFGWVDKDGVIKAVVIPLWHRENNWFDPDQAWVYVCRVLKAPVTKVGHNAAFDLKYTRVTKGVYVTNCVFDTMLCLHDINSGIQGHYGLKMAVWDWIPETGLGGYTDVLTIDSKAKEVDEDESQEERVQESPQGNLPGSEEEFLERLRSE